MRESNKDIMECPWRFYNYATSFDARLFTDDDDIDGYGLSISSPCPNMGGASG